MQVVKQIAIPIFQTLSHSIATQFSRGQVPVSGRVNNIINGLNHIVSKSGRLYVVLEENGVNGWYPARIVLPHLIFLNKYNLSVGENTWIFLFRSGILVNYLKMKKSISIFFILNTLLRLLASTKPIRFFGLLQAHSELHFQHLNAFKFCKSGPFQHYYFRSFVCYDDS